MHHVHGQQEPLTVPEPHIVLSCAICQVTFNVDDPAFKLADLLALELHKFEDEVSEIVDRAQKEEKMEIGLQKLDDVWTKVAFQFTKHKDTDVFTVRMAEEDFEVRPCSLTCCREGSCVFQLVAIALYQACAPLHPHFIWLSCCHAPADAGGQPSSHTRHDGQPLHGHLQRAHPGVE